MIGDHCGVRVILETFRVAFSLVAIVFLGLGVPGFWVWVGSRVQGGTAPSFLAIMTFLGGITITYGLVALAIAWHKGRSAENRDQPVRYAWNRSMRGERYVPAKTTRMENVLMVATVVVAIVVAVWFFFFGDPGTPAGQ